LFSALLAILLVAGACSGGGEALGPAGAVGSPPTVTSTTARLVDPAVIPTDPADIDEAYVQAVVDALFEVDAKATTIFLETQAPEQRAIEYLRAIYLQEELDQQVDVWFQSLARGTETLIPGKLENDVTRLIGKTDDCVYLEVEVDFSATTTRDVGSSINYLGLTPKRVNDDPSNLNPTAWMLFSDGVNLDGSEPENPCAGR
jgi:hypothetical protein